VEEAGIKTNVPLKPFSPLPGAKNLAKMQHYNFTSHSY